MYKLETMVGGDGDLIDLNCVCVCVCARACAHTGNNGWWGWQLHRPEPCVCVCVCARVCTHTRVHTLETRVGGDGDHIELNQETPSPTVCSPLPASAAATSESAGTCPAPFPAQEKRSAYCLPVSALETWDRYESHGALILTHWVTALMEADSRGMMAP